MARSLSSLSIAIVLAVAIASSPQPARAQDDDPRAVARRVHDEGGYPSDVTPVEPEPGSNIDLEGGGNGPRGDTRLDRDRAAGERGTGDPSTAPWMRQLLEWLGAISSVLSGPLGWLLLVLGISGVALLVGYLAVRIQIRRSSSLTVDASARDAALDPMLVGPSRSADALAADGLYGEAIHALFLDALGRIGRREGRHSGRTARELVHTVAQARAGAVALGQLLDVTELVWFGGREASEAQYEHARALAAQVPEASDAPDASREIA